MHDKDWLKSECVKWFDHKCNDVLKLELLRALKDEAVSRGFDRMDVSWCIHGNRKERDAAKNSRECASMGVSNEELQPAETKPEEAKEVNSLPEKELARKVTQRFDDLPGINPSGGKARQSKVSIIDMAEGRV